ncbi:hypothetical protein [Pontibacter harenae]|uniref:hypothetical protein n=1 Tax=Pontibacter harenae TaxID=2894083 RepID=UPI001E336710|nr:hypothetical protein [Pontibacter harenae]MCC9165511.1 hypothetical protein [Pontibacter harenae]
MMKTTQKYVLALVATIPLAAFSITASAQTTPVPPQINEHIIIAAERDYDAGLETLSGINLHPAKKGTFQLDFDQPLKEDGVLEISNEAGQLVYQKPVSNTKKARSYNVGKLKPDTYLIEVKTTDTTYWTRFRIGK